MKRKVSKRGNVIEDKKKERNTRVFSITFSPFKNVIENIPQKKKKERKKKKRRKDISSIQGKDDRKNMENEGGGRIIENQRKSSFSRGRECMNVLSRNDRKKKEPTEKKQKRRKEGKDKRIFKKKKEKDQEKERKEENHHQPVCRGRLKSCPL